ncbi:MAG: transcriptional repressor NrdR [Clostridia bacterium]|nr:transcriptional repressor NrdR [Clostridia bacterium]
MKCIYCECTSSKVIDSRVSEDGTCVRRRRECCGCGRRFTTHEVVEQATVFVVKKGGGRQEFDINKVRAGIVKACEKRPVPIVKIERLVAEVAKAVNAGGVSEITTEKIGNLVMEGLKEIDDVAYVRYCSVYQEFKDVETFMTKISEILNKNKQKK